MANQSVKKIARVVKSPILEDAERAAAEISEQFGRKFTAKDILESPWNKVVDEMFLFQFSEKERHLMYLIRTILAYQDLGFECPLEFICECRRAVAALDIIPKMKNTNDADSMIEVFYYQSEK